MAGHCTVLSPELAAVGFRCHFFSFHSFSVSQFTSTGTAFFFPVLHPTLPAWTTLMSLRKLFKGPGLIFFHSKVEITQRRCTATYVNVYKVTSAVFQRHLFAVLPQALGLRVRSANCADGTIAADILTLAWRNVVLRSKHSGRAQLCYLQKQSPEMKGSREHCRNVGMLTSLPVLCLQPNKNSICT